MKRILAGALFAALGAIPAQSVEIMAMNSTGEEVMLGDVSPNGDTELSIAGILPSTFQPARFEAMFESGRTPCEIYDASKDTPLELKADFPRSSTIRVTTHETNFGGTPATTCNVIVHKHVPADATRHHP